MNKEIIKSYARKAMNVVKIIKLPLGILAGTVAACFFSIYMFDNSDLPMGALFFVVFCYTVIAFSAGGMAACELIMAAEKEHNDQ